MCYGGLVSFLTDFADQAVILPLGLAVALALVVLGWRRGALVWLLTLCATLAAMLALKILVGVCAANLAAVGLRSPSGHTAAAAMVYGGLVALLGRAGRSGFGRVTLIAAAIALLIGLTRIGLGEHTAADVLVGGLTGCAGAVLLVRLAGAPPAHLHIGRPTWFKLAAIVVAVVILTHGLHLQAEPRIQNFARLYGWLVPVCTVQTDLAQARP